MRAVATRRQLLLAALAAAGSAAGGGWWLLGAGRVRWRRAARGWIDAAHLASVTRVGEAYLATLPLFDAEAIWREIEDRLAPWPQAGLADAAFRGRVRAAVESDFATESVVPIEGYVFDRTTAELCALVALSARTAPSSPTAS